MGTTKTTQFTAAQNRKAELYKALGHPARIAILDFLINQNSCFCGDIVDELPLSQSTISQHLTALKNVEIIQGDISGVKTSYCINDKVWTELDDMFRLLVNSYSEKNKCC